jgi:solute:Na+ symporter, SSS family
MNILKKCTSRCLFRHLRFKLVFIFCLVIGFITHAENHYFRFSTLPDLPPNSGHTTQPGLAGPYTGMDDGVLIIAGGANFPR